MATVVDELADGQDYYRELFRRGTLVEEPFLIQHAPGYEVWRNKGEADLPFPDLPFAWDPNELRTRQFATLLASRQSWTIDVVSIGNGVVREIDVALELIREAQGR
jgi:hypothetical protein